MPLVDINDQQEKKHLLERICELEPQRKEGSSVMHYDASDPVDHELWQLTQRLSLINAANERRDATHLDVNFKDPKTFKPWTVDQVLFQMGYRQ